MLVEDYIQSIRHLPLVEINKHIEQKCGISDFFSEIGDMDLLVDEERGNKDEYGDWQTNEVLSHKVTELIATTFQPQVILEPTCGKGSLVLAALDTFSSIDEVYAIEIYKPYLQALKFEILQRYLDRYYYKPIKFHLLHADVFSVDWDKIKKEISDKKLLILGNPPWVTNSELSKIDSNNLPVKSNFKHENGFAAMTGKGNFDIAEYICHELMKHFATGLNQFGLLLKNSVVKQICLSQQKIHHNIAELRQYNIDSHKEFGASVDASLFTCRAGEESSVCEVYDLYTKKYIRQFGWVGDRFVSDIDAYSQTSSIDGVSQLVWWSGVKHDCQSVVELTKTQMGYINKLGELVKIEEDCVYPYVKSSDIKGETPHQATHYIILTQHYINEDTECLKQVLPLTYSYLSSHRDYFDKRKSSIYKNRSPFCMFGIGSYTFKPYKIVVSGLYKSPKFTLLKPIDGKVVIADDTCYQLGFDTQEEAEFVLKILKSTYVSEFMKSVSFVDSKRLITKELLMRINLHNVVKIMKDNKLITDTDILHTSKLYSEPLLFAV